MKALLEFIGHDVEGAIDVEADNQAAYDLCHRYTSAQNTRHIDRKMFKMRELRGVGVVNVRHVPTEDNAADLFRKVLGWQLFEKHRRCVLNLAAGEVIEAARQAKANATAKK